jgi:16S rRNA (cytosine967-C5)-methyltransferase
VSGDGAAVRAQAALALNAVYGGRSLREALAPLRVRLADSRDRALLTAMVLAALRRAFRYRALRQRLLARPLPRAQGVIAALIDIGLAQIESLAMPPHAAVAATVEASRQLGHPRLAGLVNALLRRYLREQQALDHAVADSSEVACEHPDWLRQRLTDDWPQLAGAIMAANLTTPPLWLRTHPLRVARDDYAARLRTEGLAPETVAGLDQALKLPAMIDPATLPGFAAGHVSVQDGGAQWATVLLDALPGERVLDACAAPGGKAAHMLERAGGRLELLALDSDGVRLQRVRDTLDRLGLEATLRCADAGDAKDWWDGRPFDRILLDAPCSGSGVIRRHPDIRLHRRASDLTALTAAQARLLSALWPMLKPGGRLVYVTCSVLRDENDRQIDAFLARHADATAVDPLPVEVGRRLGAGRQILPGEHDMDGFFLVALEKRAAAPPAADGLRRDTA